MKKIELTYRPFGEEALLIEWPSRIDEEILYDILSFQKSIEEKLSTKIEETVNTYHALTVFFNDGVITFRELVEELKEIRKAEKTKIEDQHTIWDIPVCYDLHFGIDLTEIATKKNLSIDEIINLHSENIYTVYFTGFLPGFLYLGGLSEKLFTPRKETPRTKIIKGSVAIGGSQTGIYPQESPGGWNIIGNSPILLFDVNENPPCKINAGDKIKIYPISKTEYGTLSKKIEDGSFVLTPKRE